MSASPGHSLASQLRTIEKSMSKEFNRSPWPHRLAVVTGFATVLLIFVGGLVTNTGSALAVPDWPTTFGYNMFLYPWSKMVGGVFYEHSHRLLGSAVGLLTVALAVCLWACEPRRWVRRLGGVAVAAVIVQGVLGGLRVVLLQHDLAMIHACVAQAFLALVVSLAVITAPGWRAPFLPLAQRDIVPLSTLALVSLVFVYMQLGIGAVLTHTGSWFIVHLAMAGLATAAVGLFSARVSVAAARSSLPPSLYRPAGIILALLGVQLSLGLGAYLWRFGGLSASLSGGLGLLILALHRLTGTLLWAATVVLSLRVVRLRVLSGDSPIFFFRPATRLSQSTNDASSEVLA